MRQSIYEVKTPLQLEDLDRNGGVLYSFYHRWSPMPGEHSSVSGGYFLSREASDFARNSALANMGYSNPRWWQWWRWGERRIVFPPHPSKGAVDE